MSLFARFFSAKHPEPHISIGLPVFNEEKYLGACLDSLLQQTHHNFELLISDNASTDATPRIIAEYAARDPRIRVLSNPTNIGAVANFAKVLEVASAEYFTWAGADDLWAPDFLAACLRVLEQTPAAVSCSCDLRFIDGAGESIAQDYTHLDGVDLAQRRVADRVARHVARAGWYSIYGLHRTAAARSAVAAMGELRDSYGWDVLFELLLLCRGKIPRVPRVLFYYRQRKSGEHERYTSTTAASDAKSAFFPGGMLGAGILRALQLSGLPPEDEAQARVAVLNGMNSSPAWQRRMSAMNVLPNGALAERSSTYRRFFQSRPWKVEALMTPVREQRRESASPLRCALIEYNRYHDHVMPALVRFLNLLGLHVEVFMTRELLSRRIWDCNRDLALTLYELDEPVVDFLSTAFGFRQYDFLVANSLEPEETRARFAPIDIPILGVVHNVAKVSADAEYRAFFDQEGRAPLLLSPHVAATAEPVLGKSPWVLPVYLKDERPASGTPGDVLELCVPGQFGPRRNYASLLDALEFFTARSSRLLAVRIVGNNRNRFGDEFRGEARRRNLHQFLHYSQGELSHDDFYREVERAHFLLPLIDRTSEQYRRYFEGTFTSAAGNTLGLGIPAILHRDLAASYGIAGVLYEDGGLGDALLRAAALSRDQYAALQSALRELREALIRESVENLRTTLLERFHLASDALVPAA